jgi:hypothetical protein
MRDVGGCTGRTRNQEACAVGRLSKRRLQSCVIAPMGSRVDHALLAIKHPFSAPLHFKCSSDLLFTRFPSSREHHLFLCCPREVYVPLLLLYGQDSQPSLDVSVRSCLGIWVGEAKQVHITLWNMGQFSVVAFCASQLVSSSAHSQFCSMLLSFSNRTCRFSALSFSYPSAPELCMPARATGLLKV